MAKTLIHPTAIIHPTAKIGMGTKIWAFVQVGEYAIIGKSCVIGNGAYIDRHVQIGDDVRIHNKALLYHGLIVEDNVFIGPGVCFTNDQWPRSGSTRDLKNISWKIRKGATVGANATILPDIEIGAHSIVGAGSVVTHNVPSNSIALGNPARVKGFICSCGKKTKKHLIPCKLCRKKKRKTK